MKTSNISGGTLQITLANASQYIIIGLFYVIVTKTNALTQTDIGTLSILTFLASTFSLLTMLALPTALTMRARALKNQDFELLKQALPKPLTKYLNILEGIIVR